MRLELDISVPLYVQLAEKLQVEIQKGTYPEGSRLPSERELAEQHNISRMTARQALKLLIQKNIASSRVGKGTFVSTHKINQELRELTSFSEDMLQRGKQTTSKVTRAEIIEAAGTVAELLEVPSAAEIALLQRIRYVEDKPIALETAYLRHSYCPGILQIRDFSNHSLYQTLREIYGIRIAWARQSIESRLPVEFEQQTLRLGECEPILGLTRVTHNHLDEPFEYVASVYNGKFYQFQAVLRRPEEIERDGQ